MTLDTSILSQTTTLAGRMNALVPTIAQRAAEAQTLRRMPDNSISELLEAGAARALVPRRWGGDEDTLSSWLEATRIVSQADGSHGWCANLIIHMPIFVTAFSEAAQAEVWGESPDVIIAGSIAPTCKVQRVDGGFRISGMSPFSSGVHHAKWSVVAGMAAGDQGQPVWTMFLIPSSAYEVVDTWHAAGMQATGSNTIKTTDLFVPDTHTVQLESWIHGTGPGAVALDNPMYRLPMMLWTPLGFATVALGVATGVRDALSDHAGSHNVAGGMPMADIVSVQTRLAEESANLDAAELLIERAVNAVDQYVAPSLKLRARTMRDSARASQIIVAAVDRLFEMFGTSAFTTNQAVQQAWRDVHFARTHLSLNSEMSFAHWGRLDMGLDPAPSTIYL